MRYLRILGLMFRVSLQNEAAYRLDFFLQFAAALLHLGALLMGFWVIFHNTDSINGWGPYHMLALAGVFRMVGAVIGLIIAPNMRTIMEDVRTGTLDFLLLKPINSQFLGSVRRVAIWRTIDLLFGAVLAAIGCVKLNGTIPIQALGVFLVMLAAAAVICYAVWLVLATLSFWLVRVQNIEMVFWNLFEAVRYPISIYGPNVQWTLTYILPVVFIVQVPAQALVGGTAGAAGEGVAVLTHATWLAAAVFAPLSLLAATLFWRHGLKHYSGASS